MKTSYAIEKFCDIHELDYVKYMRLVRLVRKIAKLGEHECNVKMTDEESKEHDQLSIKTVEKIKLAAKEIGFELHQFPGLYPTFKDKQGRETMLVIE